MDFKIAGTRKGITAIQLDIKPAGIPLDIVCESLEPARKGREHILDRMEQEISSARSMNDGSSPRLATLKMSNDSLRKLIFHRKRIEQEAGYTLKPLLILPLYMLHLSYKIHIFFNFSSSFI
jgi:polyribonucleotide nucleotidyltransferase